MAKRNRHRQHQQNLHRQRSDDLRWKAREQPESWQPGRPVDRAAVIRVMTEAETAHQRLHVAAADRAVDALHAMAASSPEALYLVSASIVSSCALKLRRCWDHGWQPADIVFVAASQLTPVHGELVAAAIAQEAIVGDPQPVHPDWAQQLQQLGAWWTDRQLGDQPWTSHLRQRIPLDLRQVIEHVLDLNGVLGRLPVLPHLIPQPGPGADRVAAARPAGATALDPKVLVKVRGLLAKAESTEFAEEAESLTVKAQELMARHSIDEAMVAAGKQRGGGTFGDGPAGRRVHLVAPYVDAKAGLVHAVASANRCHAVFAQGLGFVTLFGFPSDLAVVDLLFTSLLSQATSAMVAAGRVLDRSGTSRTRSFRSSFLVAFSSRIGQRLRDAAEASVQEAKAEHGASLLPVLASRDEAVSERVAELFPKLVSRRTRVASMAGWEAGVAAADQAQLGAWTPVGQGSSGSK